MREITDRGGRAEARGRRSLRGFRESGNCVKRGDCKLYGNRLCNYRVFVCAVR